MAKCLFRCNASLLAAFAPHGIRASVQIPVSPPDPEDANRPLVRGPLSTDLLAALIAVLVLVALLVTALLERPSRLPWAASAKSPTPTPAQAPMTPVPAVETDFAAARTFLPLRESEVGRIYSVSPRNLKALRRVAKIGGYGSPEAMAAAFGYESVDQMLNVWNQALASGRPPSGQENR